MYLLMISTTLDDIPAYYADNPYQCEGFYRAIEEQGIQEFVDRCLEQIGRDSASFSTASILKIEPHNLEFVKEL